MRQWRLGIFKSDDVCNPRNKVHALVLNFDLILYLNFSSKLPVHYTPNMLRFTPRLLARPSSVGTQSGGLRPPPLALLPPIPLYRRLLRAHRTYLPPEMRLLGDSYIKSEFRAHRDVENPVHIVGFLSEWQTYAQRVEGEAWRGEKLDMGKLDKMSDQQLGQLHELMSAIREKELGENDPEYLPHQPPAPPTTEGEGRG